MSKRLERAKAKWTRSAISIQASGHVNGRINRPDTRKHLNLRAQLSKNLLHPKWRPHTDTPEPMVRTVTSHAEGDGGGAKCSSVPNPMVSGVHTDFRKCYGWPL